MYSKPELNFIPKSILEKVPDHAGLGSDIELRFTGSHVAIIGTCSNQLPALIPIYNETSLICTSDIQFPRSSFYILEQICNYHPTVHYTTAPSFI